MVTHTARVAFCCALTRLSACGHGLVVDVFTLHRTPFTIQFRRLAVGGQPCKTITRLSHLQAKRLDLRSCLSAFSLSHTFCRLYQVHTPTKIFQRCIAPLSVWLSVNKDCSPRISRATTSSLSLPGHTTLCCLMREQGHATPLQTSLEKGRHSVLLSLSLSMPSCACGDGTKHGDVATTSSAIVNATHGGRGAAPRRGPRGNCKVKGRRSEVRHKRHKERPLDGSVCVRVFHFMCACQTTQTKIKTGCQPTHKRK